MKGLKQRLKKGEMLIGTFLSLGNAFTTEIVANAGFDWVMIDLEHGIGSEADVLHQLQGIDRTQIAAIVRVEGFQRQRVHRVLDFGADGIMCPRIEDAVQAELAVKAMYYPPKGVRGLAKMVPASNYGKDFDQYLREAAEDLLCVIQIETLAALNHLDAIARLSDVDVLFIGPSDLSMALGIFGQLDHPLFVKAVHAIIDAAMRANKHVGILLLNLDDLEKYYDLGVRFFAYGTDAFFLSMGAKQAVEALHRKRL